MDVDPLADTVPPRYAVESDDEDEYNPLPSHSSTKAAVAPQVNIEIVGNTATKCPLAVMSGPAAAHWARGAALGEQKGAVYVNSKMVGLLFVPSWTDSVVLVSETARDTTLPLWAQHQYAQAVLNHYTPTNMVLLDTYFSKGYISSSEPPTGAPVRHLAVNHTPSPNLRVPLYAPPNLVHTTSAAFMALLYLQSLEPQGSKVPGLLLLAPSSTLPPPPPTTIEAGEEGRSHFPMMLSGPLMR